MGSGNKPVAAAGGWHPTCFKFLIKVLPTSMATAIVETDAGQAYIKVIGNGEGPHALACDFVGTRLAKLLGLPTFELAIFELEEIDRFDLINGLRAEAGPVFATRSVAGRTWGGTTKDLAHVANPQDIAGLVVVDTWVRNHDRYLRVGDETRRNIENVFLSERGASRGDVTLTAMDFSHAFTHGRRPDRRTHFGIGASKEERTYGAFPEFSTHVTKERLAPFLGRLEQVTEEEINEIIGEVPKAWEARKDILQAWVAFLMQRAQFLADKGSAMIMDHWQLTSK